MLTSVLFALYIIDIIVAVILGKSEQVGGKIVCAIIWDICTIIGLSELKHAQYKTLYSKVFNFTDRDENKEVIYVNYKEVDNNEEKLNK